MKQTIILIYYCFIVYIVFPSLIYNGDAAPAQLLPFNILKGDGLYFDNFINLLKQNSNPYFLQIFHGHYISSYPIFSGILVLPVYLIFYIFLYLNNLTDYSSLFVYSLVASKISSALIASISVGLLFEFFKKIGGDTKLSITFALIFGFATQTFSISSQALWQHGSANLFLILSLLFLTYGFRNHILNKRKWFFWGSLISAIFSTWARMNFLIFTLLLTFALLIINSKDRFKYFGTLMLGLTIILGYNFYFLHAFLGGQNSSAPHLNFSNAYLGFAGLFISPARGMIIYTPLFISGLIALFLFKPIQKKFTEERVIFNLLLIYFWGGFFLNSLWQVWWGGWSWGDRLLTDIAVPAVILSFFVYKLINRRLFRILFYSLVVYSIFIQIIGIIFYPFSHWDSSPKNVDQNPQRLWDFTDNPISRSIFVFKNH